MTKYPNVVDEHTTLDLVLEGKSIARYGDGEFNLVRGGNCVSQQRCRDIQEELRTILTSNWDSLCQGEMLVAIPRPDKRSPKFNNWSKLAPLYAPYLRDHVTYYSSFITRPDSAPWISTQEYFDKVESLWAGQDITMVYGSARSLSAEFPAMKSARSIHVVDCDYAHTYHRINELVTRVAAAKNHRVLLMCGPTATCLAWRLSTRGFHAIDLGHIGMWWRSYANPKLAAKLVTLG